MSVINKSLAIPMLPIGILIILEALNMFVIDFAMDKIIIGAILMMALQISSLLHAKIHNGFIGLIHWALALTFIAPAVFYIFTPFFKSFMPLIIGVGMILESFYALF